MKNSIDTPSLALEQQPVSRLFRNYAVPAILATAASSLYNIIDRIIIGQGVGPLAISGLALTFPIMNLSIAFGTLIGSGSSAIASIRLGEHRYREANRVLGNSLILTVVISLFVTFLFLLFLYPLLLFFKASNDTLPYARDFLKIILYGIIVSNLFYGLNGMMRATGHPKKAMVSILLTVGLNLILALLFVLGFHWGIRGAAWATVLAQLGGLAWVLAHFLNPKTEVRFTRESIRFDWKITREVCAIGLSPFLIHLCSCVVIMLINMQLKRYGDMDFTGISIDGKPVAGGDLAIGAFGIINSIVGFMVMVIFGLAHGLQPIAGYNYGAGRLDRVREALRLAIQWATVVSVVTFALCMLFPKTITGIFTKDYNTTLITARGLRLYVSMFVFTGFQVVTSILFQSVNKAGISILLSTTRQVLFLVPCLLLLPTLFHTDGVWISQAAADLLAALVTAGVLLYHLRRGVLKK
ncbi:MAG: MATE family efflux transporter [Bacteroidales bacterium]|nr:MATE family efflux transporter [Bacteroidales bacterium]